MYVRMKRVGKISNVSVPHAYFWECGNGTVHETKP